MNKTISLKKLKKVLSRRDAEAQFRELVDRDLGSGCQRSAYLVGGYVVKANSGAWNMRNYSNKFKARYSRVPAKKLRALGIQPPRVWYAGPRGKRVFVIMPYYRAGNCVPNPDPDSYVYVARIPEVAAKFYRRFKTDHILPNWKVAPGVTIVLDLHDQNVGLRADGKIVAFDW